MKHNNNTVHTLPLGNLLTPHPYKLYRHIHTLAIHVSEDCIQIIIYMMNTHVYYIYKYTYRAAKQ